MVKDSERLPILRSFCVDSVFPPDATDAQPGFPTRYPLQFSLAEVGMVLFELASPTFPPLLFWVKVSAAVKSDD